jgi:hypothetical protein
MNTQYKNRVRSPYITSNKTATAVVDRHFAEEELAKSIGKFDFSATFTKDDEAVAMFKDTPHLVALVCTLKLGNVIIGRGRAMNVLGPNNKYIGKAVQSVWNYAFLDSVSKASRIMDTLHLSSEAKSEDKPVTTTSYEIADSTSELITDKQKSYLIELITTNIESEYERNSWISQLDEMTRSEASETIKSLKQ